MREFPTYTIEKIQENLDSELAEFYNQNSSRSNAYSESYQALIEELLQKECADKDARSLSKLYTQKIKIRNNKHKRYYTKCQNMIDTKMWETAENTDAFCFQDVLLNFRVLNETQRQSLYNNRSMEEVSRDRLKEVEAWAKDPSAKMIDYPGTEKKTAKSVLSNFLLDLTIDILRVIQEKFDNDLQGQTVSYLENLSNKAIFGATREKIKINQGGITKIKIFRNETHTKCTTITYDGTGGEDFIYLFDETDLELISYLATRSIQAPPTERPIIIEEMSLVRISMGNSDRVPSKKDYTKMKSRMQKIRHAVFDFDDKEGSYTLIGDYKFIKRGGREYLAYYPGGFMESQVENGMIMRLPADVKNELDYSVAKLLYVPFMQQRIRIYRLIANGQKENGQYTVLFKYADFLTYVNFGDGNQKDGRDSIDKALRDYIRIGKLVKSFSYSKINDAYTITFYELSDTEIKDIDFMLYNRGPKIISDDIVGQILLTDLLPG